MPNGYLGLVKDAFFSQAALFIEFEALGLYEASQAASSPQLLNEHHFHIA